jgi:hypothetical protein
MTSTVQVIRRLSQSETLLDVLLAFEDFLDNNDIYAFKNWSLGEVFAGPKIEKYWVTVTLRYDYKCMPDPQGGMRLIKGGAKVWFEKAEVEDTRINNELGLLPGFMPSANLMQRTQDVPVEKLPKKSIWLVTISIPRRFVDDVNDIEHAEFMDHVQMEIMKSARSAGIDSQTEFKDNQEPESDEKVK